MEKLPEIVKVESEFGIYEMSIQKINGLELRYKRKIQLFNGLYGKDKYESYREFRRAIKKSDNLKIILSK